MNSTANSIPDFRVVIPARLAARRFPNKLLTDINGKSLIQRVYENAVKSEAAEVVVATDSDEIAACITDLQGTVCMTSSDHASGSDRIAEAVKVLGWADDTIVVNLQGDEPFLSPEDISSLAVMLLREGTDMATLATPLATESDKNDESIVKVVRNKDNTALYFSRAPIPHGGVGHQCLHHIGIYAYSCAYLRYFAQLQRPVLEQAESLEQLRALFDGAQIYVGDAQTKVLLGIDTPDDLAKARCLLID